MSALVTHKNTVYESLNNSDHIQYPLFYTAIRVYDSVRKSIHIQYLSSFSITGLHLCNLQWPFNINKFIHSVNDR
jgi:hypothetical protein